MGSKTGKKAKKLAFDDAMAEMALLKPRLDAAAATLSSRSAELLAPYEAARKRAVEAATAADEMLKQVRAAVAGITGEVQRMRRRHETLKRVVDRGPGREAPVRGKVENPERADDLVAQQLTDGSAGQLLKEGRFAGLVDVDIRLSTRIGGLARVDGVTEFQMLAAARFRSFWDQAQIGGARAIDYTVPRVDTSGSSQASVMNMAEDALAEYSKIVQGLGMLKANLVQMVVCEDMSIRAVARKLGRGDGGRASVQLRDELMLAVDDLARLLHIGPAQPRGGIRGEGERAPWVVGGVAEQSVAEQREDAA